MNRSQTTNNPPAAGRAGRRRLAAAGLILALGAGLLLALVVSTGMGFIRIPPETVLRILVSRAAGQAELLSGIDELFPVVVMDVRLPRILCAALVGGGLAMCGVVFQGLLLNPLADPYTLGVSAGAAFGASLAILFNLTALGTASVPLAAFLGAAATLAAVLFLAYGSGGPSSNNLILSGIIVAAILSAGISFLKYLADEQVAVIIFWLMGSFAARTWADVALTAAGVAAALAVFIYHARELNLMALGPQAAASLGVDTRRVTVTLLAAASLLAAVCVAVSGIIGFVGLLVPHLMRGVIGPDNRRLLAASLLAGAVLLLAADTLTRAVLPAEVPIGVLTALIGGPFFCWVFQRQRRERRIW